LRIKAAFMHVPFKWALLKVAAYEGSRFIPRTIQNVLWWREKLFLLTANLVGKQGLFLGSRRCRRRLFLCIRRKFLGIRILRTFLLTGFFL
jgi:hypothetical protein